MRKFVLALVPLALSACSGFNAMPSAQGGAAEQALVQPTIDFTQGAPLQATLLQQQWLTHQLHIKLLTFSGGLNCMPAQMQQLQVRADTSLRLLQANRLDDTRLEMIQLQHQLMRVERQLRYLNQAVHCAPNQLLTQLDVDEWGQLQSAINQNIEFELDSAQLSPQGQQALQAVYRLVQPLDSIKLQINGFTDDQGGTDYNQQLSLQRAHAIRDYLQTLGMDTSRLLVDSFGENYPLVPNDSPSHQQMNRRAQLALIAPAKPKQQGMAQNQWFKHQITQPFFMPNEVPHE